MFCRFAEWFFFSDGTVNIGGKWWYFWLSLSPEKKGVVLNVAVARWLKMPRIFHIFSVLFFFEKIYRRWTVFFLFFFLFISYSVKFLVEFFSSFYAVFDLSVKSFCFTDWMQLIWLMVFFTSFQLLENQSLFFCYEIVFRIIRQSFVESASDEQFFCCQ